MEKNKGLWCGQLPRGAGQRVEESVNGKGKQLVTHAKKSAVSKDQQVQRPRDRCKHGLSRSMGGSQSKAWSSVSLARQDLKGQFGDQSPSEE